MKKFEDIKIDDSKIYAYKILNDVCILDCVQIGNKKYYHWANLFPKVGKYDELFNTFKKALSIKVDIYEFESKIDFLEWALSQEESLNIKYNKLRKKHFKLKKNYNEILSQNKRIKSMYEDNKDVINLKEQHRFNKYLLDNHIDLDSISFCGLRDD